MIQTRRNSHGRRERQKAKSRHVRTQRRWLQPERLEERTLLAANPFHNGFWPEDVNNDLRVNAMDALHVINALNQSGSRELLAPGEVAPDMADVPFYTDVSADGALSAVDALRVVNTINGGEGEIAPSDVVRYRLATTDMNGNAISAVNVGQTFQVRGYVQDVRLNGGSTTAGNPTGVFAAYMDVLMTNANLATVRYGETQELRMDATRPGGVWGTGEIRLTYAGQQTGAIPYLASGNEDSAAIQSALEKLSTVGAGNVQVTSLQGADFDGRYFVRFVRNLGERDIAPMTVQGSGLLGSYQDVNDDDQDGDKTEFLPFAPAPQIVDNYISVNPTTPEQEDALFRSSFVFFDPYLNGPSAAEEPLEAGQPAGSRQFGEVGAFINRFSLNSPPTYTPRLEYQVFSLDVRADQSGFVQFSGNAAEQSKTLVFSLPGGGSSNTEVNPANIGFIDPALLAIAAPINVVHDTSTVLEDSGVTSIPVLANDTVNGSAGGVAPLSLVAGGLSAVNPAGSATVSISGNNVNFTPTNNFNGQVTFTYQVRDGKTPTPNTATGTVTVNVTAVNDAPVITLQSLPGPINEDAGAVPIPPGTISVADVDAGNALLQTTIAVTSGTVTLNDTTGLTFTTGDGTADANMVFTGTLTALNNATNNATFNTALNFNGPATVAITVNDQGNTGSGGAKSDTKTLSITVTAINDAPVNTVPTTTQTVIELATLTFTPPISTTDVEALAQNQPVQVNLGVNNGKLNLSTQTGLTNVTGLGTGAVSFRGTVANVNAALATLTYQANAFPQNDTFTVTTSDLGTSPLPVMTDTDQVPIAVQPSSKPSAVSDSVSVAEDSGTTTVNVLGNDIDVNSTIGPTNLIITAASDPAGGAVTLAADGKSVTYRPDNDFFGSDTFTYTIESALANKGDGPSTATVFVTVNGINDSPTIATAPTGVATAEDTAFPFSGANQISVADVDADAGGGLKVLLSVSHGTLQAPNGTVTITGANTGSLTITGLVAAVNASLAGLTYTPAKDYAGADTMNLTVDDMGHTGGGSGSPTASRAIPINVTPVNDAPTIKAPAQVSTKQDVDFTFTAGTASEISVGDIDSAQLTVALVLQSDPLKPAVDPGNLMLGTTQGVTITGGGDNSNAVTFSGPLAAVNAALNGLKYAVTLGYEGSPLLTISANDGGFNPTATVGIIVSGINDPPVNILPQGLVQVAEDNDLFFNGNLQVSDPDAGLSTVEVTLSATNATLTPVANPNVVATPMGPGSVKLTGSIANINAALNGLKYRPNQDYNGPAQLAISTNDKGNTGDPPAPGQTELIDTDTLAITVTPVNDAPVANDDGSPTNRTTVLWNTAGNAFDVLVNDNTGPDVGETLTITNVDTSNAHGAVTVQNGKLLYTPTPGYTGDAEIVYTVNDRVDGSGLTDTATVYVTVVDFVPSNVSGYVYFDADDDGIKDPGEWGVGGVMITLVGTNIQGDPVNLVTWTDEGGMYQFSNVLPCNTGTKYTLTESHPAALVDGKDTAGDQGAEMSANDQMKIFLPLFGYGAGIEGVGNNFGELGFRSDVATGLGLHDLVHSGPNGGALLFGMDAFGNVTWYMNLGGWTGYAPGRPSATSPGGFNATIQNDKLALTDRTIEAVREINATDSAIRSVYNRTGGWALGIFGDADDFDLPLHRAEAGGEGEGSSPTEGEDAELLASAGGSGDYESAVDAVLAGIA
jgi:hypothetical protein